MSDSPFKKIGSILKDSVIDFDKITDIHKVVQMNPDQSKFTYIIVDVSELDLESLESGTNHDKSLLLKAVLKSEFYDEGDDLKHIYGPITKEARPELIDDIATMINNWFGEKRDILHGLFDFITGLRPAAIAGCEIINNFAALEFTEHPPIEGVVEDIGAVDLTDLEEEEEEVEEEEGE